MRVIQTFFGAIPDAIFRCRESVLAAYPNAEMFLFPESPYPLYESDKWRWDMMLENDDILYLDCDIMLTEELTFAGDAPTMMYYQGQPDNCLMYSPDRKFFQAYEAERIRRGIKFETMGWFRKVLRDKKIHEIAGVTHLRNSGMKELIRQYSLVFKK